MQPCSGALHGKNGWPGHRQYDSHQRLEFGRPGYVTCKGGGQMTRLFRALLAAGASRAVPPVVIGFFFLLYIGIAFFTDETLITLMAFTRKSLFLTVLLALIPL